MLLLLCFLKGDSLKLLLFLGNQHGIEGCCFCFVVDGLLYSSCSSTQIEYLNCLGPPNGANCYNFLKLKCCHRVKL